MPGAILLLWLIGQGGGSRRAALGILWAGIICLALTQTFLAHHQPYAISKFPAGWTATSPSRDNELRWIADHTHPGDLFFQAGWPGVYLPLQLRNPVFLDAVGTGIGTRPEFVQRSIEQLDERRVRYILWSQLLDPADNRDLSTDSLSPLRAYLRGHYKRVQVFANREEIWERIY
jgi:hypothetical protein